MNDKKRIRKHICLLYCIGNENLIKKNSEEMRYSLNARLTTLHLRGGDPLFKPQKKSFLEINTLG
jgi:hypothetical protein